MFRTFHIHIKRRNWDKKVPYFFTNIIENDYFSGLIQKGKNMVCDKTTKSVSEIQMDFTPENITVDKMMKIFKSMKLSENFSAFDYIKESGYSVKLVLSLLIIMVVMGKRRYMPHYRIYVNMASERARMYFIV